MLTSEAVVLGLAVLAGAVAVICAAAAWRLSRRLREAEHSAADSAPAARDVSEDNQAAALLELIELAGLGLIYVDRTGRITLANAPAHRYLGRPLGSLAGESPIAAFLDHRVESLLGEAAEHRSARADLVLPGEPQRTLLLRAERDDSTGTWLVIEDVSELRRLRRIRAEFIDNLSHELRTPLTTLRVLSELLSAEAERGELPERVRDAIAKIDVETGHLVQMVTELLDLSRIEQGETPLRRDEVDLGQVIEDTVGRLRPYAERQGVPLRSEVPATSAERTVDGDAERLGQLLLNLLHNAVKFSEPGAEVAVRLQAADGTLRLEIEDHGPGIPRRDLERIFERFYKVDRARRRGATGGTGLGLAISRHIAEGHGGRIWAQSEEGAGARFIVELPRRG